MGAKLSPTKEEEIRTNLTIADIAAIDRQHFKNYQNTMLVDGTARAFIDTMQPLVVSVSTNIRDRSIALREKTEKIRGWRWLTAWFTWLVARIIESLSNLI